MAVFREGKIVTQQVGAASKDSLKSTIDSAIAQDRAVFVAFFGLPPGALS